MKPFVNSSIRQLVNSPRTCLALSAALILALSLCAQAQVVTNRSIVNSPHNLSAGGPGTIKASSESEICIFCHTPHNATPVQPLWNRAMPVNAYKTYSSNSLKSLPGQPTGTSKLCLSCHDGTIALGSVASRNQPIQMAGGITTIPATSKGNLGTDLSDDHPISFKYDADLVVKNPKLKSPASLPSNVRLDANQELQCTTCHDAHNNQYGSFLVSSNTTSQLCNTCHSLGQTEVIQHTGCNSCHQTHSAPSGPYLLKQARVADTCFTCHNGVPGPNAGPNIASLMNNVSNHESKPQVNLINHIPNNTDCKDCHESHTMKLTAGTASAPAIQGTLGQINGVTISGGSIAAAQYEYEVCLKCHADQAATVTPYVSRQITQANLRLKFTSTAVSFHPVAAKGKNPNVPSLRPPWTINSIIYCSDCHGSDTSKMIGGTGPNGPHGSSIPGLLLARNDTADFTPYTTTAYALCFRCHDNTLVVANSGPFPSHNLPIPDNQTPCTACHDSHGVPSTQGNVINNSALINFDTAIVFPDDLTHTIKFTHTGNSHGNCTLKCHNKNHNATPY